MWKSPENDAMPYARESTDKEKTNHKYKDKIPQKHITTADPSSSIVIMACDLYCCRFGRFPREALIAALKFLAQYVVFLTLFHCQLSHRTEDVSNTKLVSLCK